MAGEYDVRLDAAELIVAKARRGRTGTVRLHFDGERQKFSDPARR